MTTPDRPGPSSLESAGASPETEGCIAQISSLLMELDERPSLVMPRVVDETQLTQLVQVRLGLAHSLFESLRAKHEHTAQHCLRVSMACSAWARELGLADSQCEELELAALLHDVGKLGVPDHILEKPEELDDQETAIMDRHWDVGQRILKACCVSQAVLDTASYARSWYDGSRGRLERIGDHIPLGARMLTIVDAFDSMLTEQVYRAALPLERAYHELYAHAGTQFDPALVALFLKLFEPDQLIVREQVSRRWLRDLHPDVVNLNWGHQESTTFSVPRTAEALFQQKLLDNMYDAVVFVDSNLRIMLWNRGAERLTGITSESVHQRMWLPSLVKMRDERGRTIKDPDCPAAHSIRSGVQWLRRLSIRGRASREIAVDAHAIPVMHADGSPLGLTLLLHDCSPEISLEERCQNLHERATKDPLTQLANRAEFDRALELFVAAHKESQRPCSLIICDIDRFKLVNDTFGHQAGDEIIQCFAQQLKALSRQGDLVGRYGGEEFVVLCADCDLPNAARRAEEIRRLFGETMQPTLEDRCVTASFGVTEVQPGDTPDTTLRRADRALLQAKEAGRNRVMQLGIGSHGSDESSHNTRVQAGAAALVSQPLLTQSPLDRTFDKLRGFIADHHATVVASDDRHVELLFPQAGFFDRSPERRFGLTMDLQLEEDLVEEVRGRTVSLTRTRINVEIKAQRNRDRRKADALARARQLLISLRAYLMALDAAPKIEASIEPDLDIFGILADLLIPGHRRRREEKLHDDR